MPKKENISVMQQVNSEYLKRDDPGDHSAIVESANQKAKKGVLKIAQVYSGALGEAVKIQEEFMQLLDHLLPLLDEHIQSARSKRMALIAEHSQILRSVKDVKQIFSDASARTTMDAMREFIELAIKFQSLAEAGVIEPMLRAMCDKKIR